MEPGATAPADFEVADHSVRAGDRFAEPVSTDSWPEVGVQNQLIVRSTNAPHGERMTAGGWSFVLPNPEGVTLPLAGASPQHRGSRKGSALTRSRRPTTFERTYRPQANGTIWRRSPIPSWRRGFGEVWASH